MAIDPIIKQGVQVTAALAIIFTASIVYQAKVKFAAMSAHRKKKQQADSSAAKTPFNRYDGSDPSLLVADRVVGNLIEWAWGFLALFWSAIVLEVPWAIEAGWLFIASRALYPVLAAAGGLSFSGPKFLITISTVPAYISLTYLLQAVVRAAFF